MRLSLITPTHKPTYLLEAYRSLQLQTVEDWEWVVVPNGLGVEIPEAIRQDPRVKLVDGGQLHNIGALKRRACDAASGDAFVEFDHDDLLTPGDALAKIAQRFEAGAGFVFSDAAVFRFGPGTPDRHPEYAPFTFSGQHGWEDYAISIYGRELRATRSFEVTPRSLAEIYYCPDHVRAWSRNAYYSAGGHNPDLSVCDDHALMVQTYLTGARFEHTGGCHYLYRMFDHNTVVLRNKLIQDTTREIKETHFQAMVQSWLDREGLPRLDLTDLRHQGWRADRDLLQGFGLDQYGHIVADAELQRLPGWQVREFMNEAYEALVPGGYLTITVPEVHSGMAYGDVEWQSHFSAVSMDPYTRKQAARHNGNIRCRFQQINCIEVYPSDWHRDHGFKFLKFELAALKGQRFPGLQHI
jgi:glycosyltransferase involved in cell wall biosynthesis